MKQAICHDSGPNAGLRFGVSLLSVAVALGLGAPAQAQSNGDEQPAAQGIDDASPAGSTTGSETDEIVVIGTGTNISGVAPVGGQAIVMDREEILSTGKSTIADVVRTLPQLQATGSGGSQTFVETATGGNSVNQGNVVRGSSLNIRGIGQGATLLLVDGHRIAPAGTESSFAEANLLPISAVERIEVLTEGASAIYGSDAIAGVVNYILRKDFEGIEANARYTFGEYADSWAVGVTAGTHWSVGLGEGNIIATYEHSQQDPWFRGANPRLRQDQTPYGGIDGRINGNTASPGLAGNIVVPLPDPDGPFGPLTAPNNPLLPLGQGNTYYGLPDNPNGAPLTVGQLSPNAPNLVDRGDFEDFQPEVNREQFAIVLNQDLGSWLRFYDHFFFSDRQTVTRTFYSQNANANVTVNVPSVLTNGQANPNYIAGIPGLAPGAPIPVQMNLLERVSPNGPRFVNDTPERQFSNTVGLDAELGSWNAELYYTYSQNKACGVCFLGNFINGDAGNALQAAVDSGLIDPFSTAPFNDEQLDAILGSNYQRSQNYANDVVLKLDGPLFMLPGGELRAAVGAEYYYGIQKLQNGASRGASVEVIPDADARNTRTQKAVFGELYVPLVGDEMDVPLMQELIVDAALRYDKYSDFGSTTNPRIGVNWVLSDDLTLRGNWGTAFRAPGLPELNGDVFSVVFNFGVFNNTGGAAYPGEPFVNTLFRIGGAEELTAETAETWSLGFDLTPQMIDGLRFSGTYYNIRYDNRLFNDLLGRGFGYLSSADAYAFVESFVTDINNPVTCVDSDPSTWDPTLAAVAGPGTFLYGAVTTPCQVGSFFDARRTNASYTLQDGLDFTLDYSFDTEIGRFNLGAGVTKILRNEEQLVAGDAIMESLDTIGDPVSFRARGNVTYGTGPFVGTLFVNHVGGYTNDQPISDYVVTNGVATALARDVHEIPSWTTFDLSLALNFGKEIGLPLLSGLRLSANVNNVFNNAPPIVHSTLFTNSSIDLLTHGIGQRTVQIQVAAQF